MTKKVLIYAYDHSNLGDDLFILSITRRYPQVQFLMWGDKDNTRIAQTIPNLKILDQKSGLCRSLQKIRPSLLSRYKQMIDCSCDAIVYIGGSIFIEYENWRQILNWWDYQAEHYPFYVLGANFGPYHTEDFLSEHKKVFARVKDICFRDRHSYALFEELDSSRVAPDILYATQMPHSQKQTACDEDKYIFISVIDCDSKAEGEQTMKAYTETYETNMLRLIISAAEKGYGIVLSSFCEEEGDTKAMERICQQIKKEMQAEENTCTKIKFQCVNYDGIHPEHILQMISNADLIIASRFHAAILGFAAEKPVLPVLYSDKTSRVLADAGFGGISYDIRENTDINDDITVFLREEQKLQQIASLRSGAETHFEKLDQLLK